MQPATAVRSGIACHSITNLVWMDETRRRVRQGEASRPEAKGNSIWPLVKATMVELQACVVQVDRVDELGVLLALLHPSKSMVMIRNCFWARAVQLGLDIG